MRTTMCDLGYDDATSDIFRRSENAFSKPNEWINSVTLSKIIVAEGFKKIKKNYYDESSNECVDVS
ncbi:MAG: hypothetical protein WBZ36_05755 [Candidatus Nitrosopolaris sp.]|jgi:hypothetical protein